MYLVSLCNHMSTFTYIGLQTNTFTRTRIHILWAARMRAMLKSNLFRRTATLCVIVRVNVPIRHSSSLSIIAETEDYNDYSLSNVTYLLPILSHYVTISTKPVVDAYPCTHKYARLRALTHTHKYTTFMYDIRENYTNNFWYLICAVSSTVHLQ